MAGVITAGIERGSEIYEPNVCVILRVHAYIYEVESERVCVRKGARARAD